MWPGLCRLLLLLRRASHHPRRQRRLRDAVRGMEIAREGGRRRRVLLLYQLVHHPNNNQGNPLRLNRHLFRMPLPQSTQPQHQQTNISPSTRSRHPPSASPNAVQPYWAARRSRLISLSVLLVGKLGSGPSVANETGAGSIFNL